MQQVIIDFGEINLFGQSVGLRIYGYGLMLVLGFLVGIYLARWRARRFGEDQDAVTSLGLLALVAGVAGSRAAFVIERWDSQFAWHKHPLPEIFNITSGGLIYYGGAALAVIAIAAYLRLRRLPMRRYMDIIAPSLMIGLAFGRMGCLLNGCCYGARCGAHYSLGMRFPYAAKPLLRYGKGPNSFGGAASSPAFHSQAATLPEEALREIGVRSWLFRKDRDGNVQRSKSGERLVKMPSELTPAQARQAAALRSLPIQPAQAFGAINALLITGVLLGFSRLRRREGQVFALMLVLYPITRFVLESLRGDNPHALLQLELTHNQYTSVAMLLSGLLIWFVLRWMSAEAGPSWRERLAAAETRKSASARQRKGSKS